MSNIYDMIRIDGKALSNTIKEEIAEEVKRISGDKKRPPHLAAVLVGEDPASAVYVRNKVKSDGDFFPDFFSNKKRFFLSIFRLVFSRHGNN